MLYKVCKSKIHRAIVTDANLHYEGSITIDAALLEKAQISPYEIVQVVDLNNGNRLETYVMPGEKGSGTICINGAAARLVLPQDTVIIISYGYFNKEELKNFKPITVYVDGRNKEGRCIMNHPDELKYTKEHTWVKVEGSLATVGITDYSQSELGEIVFVELPEIETEVEHLTEFGVVESVKTVSDLYSPVSGVVVETNEDLLDNPEIVNDSPYDDGWMLKVEMNDPKELASLMSAEEYQDFVETLQR